MITGTGAAMVCASGVREDGTGAWRGYDVKEQRFSTGLEGRPKTLEAENTLCMGRSDSDGKTAW